jgi:hypothetical protein
VTKSLKHRVRAAPNLQACEVGQIQRGQVVVVDEQVSSSDGVWVRLHPDSQKVHCDPAMQHLEAWSLKERNGITYLLDKDSNVSHATVHNEYFALGDVPLAILKRRAFVLEYLSSFLTQLVCCMELPQSYVNRLLYTSHRVTVSDVLLAMQPEEGVRPSIHSPQQQQRQPQQPQQQQGLLAAPSKMMSPQASAGVANADNTTSALASPLPSPEMFSFLAGSKRSLETLQDMLLRVHRERYFRSAIKRTMENPSRPVIVLNRIERAKLSVFEQTCAALELHSSKVLLSGANIWKVRLVNEGVDDAGGGYSESVSDIIEEVVNGAPALLIKTPNGQFNSGDNQDVFLLNPRASSPYELKLMRFLGVLIGVAIRTNNPICLPLAPCVWHQLTGMELDLRHLNDIATDFVRGIQFICKLPASAAVFADHAFPTTATSADGVTTLQMVPGDFITEQTRDQYVERTLHFRLHEFDAQVDAVRRGIADVVPLCLLGLFKAAELEEIVCGSPEFPIHLLQSIAVYKGCSATTPLVEWFWNLLSEMSGQDCSLFLRFVWGRTRMPRSVEDFVGKPFILQVMDKYEEGSERADGLLPEASTCFFTLKMPKYSSAAVLREKLLYAIRFCKSMDADAYARYNSETAADPAAPLDPFG